MQQLALIGLCLLALLLPACNGQSARNLGTVIAHAEVFDFYYLLLQPDSAGKFTLSLDLGSGCEDYAFAEDELARMLNSKQFPITHSIGGRIIPVQAGFTFEALDGCIALDEVKFETDTLSTAIVDANGTVTGRARPENVIGAHLVDVSLSAGGVLNVNAFGISVIGTTVSRTNSPGALTLSSSDLPASQIGGSSGVYSHTHLTTPYTEASLNDVLGNPSRFTAEFAYLAKQSPASPNVLLVWDGDMVLRTDL